MIGKTTKDNFTPERLDAHLNWLRGATEQEFCDASRKFAREYANLATPDNDDPLDDFLRIVRIVLDIRKASKQPLDKLQLPKRECTKNGVSTRLEMISHFSKTLHTIAPVVTVAQWKILLSDLFAAKYGGTKVRIKKKPGNQKRAAAKGLTIKEIQENLTGRNGRPISRTYAYKLYREVNKTAKK